MPADSAHLFYAEKRAWEGIATIPLSMDACQTAVNYFADLPEVVEEFGTKQIEVLAMARKDYRLGMLAYTVRTPPRIFLNCKSDYDGRRLDVLIHEITHVYDVQKWTGDTAHNHVFARNLLRMTEITVGQQYADALRTQYLKYDINYRK